MENLLNMFKAASIGPSKNNPLQHRNWNSVFNLTHCCHQTQPRYHALYLMLAGDQCLINLYDENTVTSASTIGSTLWFPCGNWLSLFVPTVASGPCGNWLVSVATVSSIPWTNAFDFPNSEFPLTCWIIAIVMTFHTLHSMEMDSLL